MPVRLTETAISKATKEVNAAKARRDLADAAEPGLRLRLTPPSGRNRNGTRTWVLEHAVFDVNRDSETV
jgi:hypothetical protein